MPLKVKRSYRPVKNTRCTAVIAAAGSSTRMDGEDKLFAELCGIPVLAHTLRAFQAAERICEIVVVTRADRLEEVCGICTNFGITKAAAIIEGGEDRAASVLNGVFAASKRCGMIAVHDGARPCVSGDIIRRTISAAAKHGAAAPGIPATSTIKRAKRGFVIDTVDREGLYEIQTPQVFDADVLKAALTNVKKNGLAITDDCSAVEMLGMSVCITDGASENIKLTTPGDIIIAEAILRKGGEGA